MYSIVAILILSLFSWFLSTVHGRLLINTIVLGCSERNIPREMQRRQGACLSTFTKQSWTIHLLALSSLVHDLWNDGKDSIFLQIASSSFGPMQNSCSGLPSVSHWNSLQHRNCMFSLLCSRSLFRPCLSLSFFTVSGLVHGLSEAVGGGYLIIRVRYYFSPISSSNF